MTAGPYIIAEIGGNAGGNFERALTLVTVARAAGADAIKTQCFNPETLTLDHDGPGFVLTEGLWEGRKLVDLYRETAMPWDWHPKLFAHAKGLGMDAFASVFCAESCAWIARHRPSAIKIASLEIVDLPLIRTAAVAGKPLILSCGMASDDEIGEAIDAAQEAPGLTLLHCPPDYPADYSQANLPRISEMLETWRLPVGLSDHTLSTTLPAVAVGLGATVIEKHLILSRTQPGADTMFSLEPQEFEAMVVACRQAARAMAAPAEKREPHRELRRSLYAVKDIRKGETLTVTNVRSIRPGYGLPPKDKISVLGRSAAADIPMGTPLKMEHVTP